jgi:hypothetical protein
MGLGPQGSSLLSKVGKQSALEMSDADLSNLIITNRDYRGKQRALGRLGRVMKDSPRKVPKLKDQSLEALGFDQMIVEKMRAANPGKSDFEIVSILQLKGVI